MERGATPDPSAQQPPTEPAPTQPAPTQPAGSPPPPPAAPGAPTPAQPAAAAAATQPAVARPAADPHARIDGLRAWLAELDRKLGIRTYIAGALLLIALLMAGGALYLAYDQRQNGATEDDVDAVRAELGTVQTQAEQAARKPVQSLTQRLGDLENEVSTLQSHQQTSDRELQVVQDDIRELRDQVSHSQSGPKFP